MIIIRDLCFTFLFVHNEEGCSFRAFLSFLYGWFGQTHFCFRSERTERLGQRIESKFHIFLFVEKFITKSWFHFKSCCSNVQSFHSFWNVKNIFGILNHAEILSCLLPQGVDLSFWFMHCKFFIFKCFRVLNIQILSSSLWRWAAGMTTGICGRLLWLAKRPPHLEMGLRKTRAIFSSKNTKYVAQKFVSISFV